MANLGLSLWNATDRWPWAPAESGRDVAFGRLTWKQIMVFQGGPGEVLGRFQVASVLPRAQKFARFSDLSNFRK